MSYQEKYLKYKGKYLTLLSQMNGGSMEAKQNLESFFRLHPREQRLEQVRKATMRQEQLRADKEAFDEIRRTSEEERRLTPEQLRREYDRLVQFRNRVLQKNKNSSLILTFKNHILGNLLNDPLNLINLHRDIHDILNEYTLKMHNRRVNVPTPVSYNGKNIYITTVGDLNKIYLLASFIPDKKKLVKIHTVE
jgi:hypothetical protein